MGILNCFSGLLKYVTGEADQVWGSREGSSDDGAFYLNLKKLKLSSEEQQEEISRKKKVCAKALQNSAYLTGKKKKKDMRGTWKAKKTAVQDKVGEL